MTTTSLENPARLRYDAVVVGARCAGAATALLLARKGLRVLAVDRGQYGTDTLSTHALMRGGVLQLHRWGLLASLEAAGTPVVRSTSFHYGDEVIRIPIKARDGVPGLYAPRRFTLDRLLVDAARAAGSEVAYGLRAADLLRSDDGRVTGVVLEDGSGNASPVVADIVIGADGLRSTVARLAGAEAYRTGLHASGSVYGYFAGLENDGYHWHYGLGTTVGRIPTSQGLTCVFASIAGRRFEVDVSHDVEGGFFQVLAECAPELAARVAAAPRTGNLRGFPGHRGFFRRPWGRGFALVGDAAYFKDPITAHGITDALRDAELLAEAVTAGSERALARYQEIRDADAMALFEVSDQIASFEWDLPALKQMHLALSEAMKSEVAALHERQQDQVAPASRTA